MIKFSEITSMQESLKDSISKKIDKKIKTAAKHNKMLAEIKFSHRIPTTLVKEVLEDYKKEGFDATSWYKSNFLSNGLNFYVMITWYKHPISN